jgi:FAD/FMN-containing dehydrogenase
MDWVDLFIGSEGILGVVTEAELGLLPRPKALITGVVFMPGDEQVIQAVSTWRDIPGLRMIEYLDGPSLGLLRDDYPDIPASALGALLFEQEVKKSQEDEIEDWLDRLEAVEANLDGSWFASSDRDRERFRAFRHALPESVNDRFRRQGFQKLGSDYAVPAEDNGEMLRYYRSRLEAEFGGRYVIFGHIGDAHLHVNILPASAGDYERGRALMLDFARKAVSLGGTVSTEHGLGKRKRDLLQLQYSEAETEAMRAVKQRLDPTWRLGRGNLLAPPQNK